MWGHLKTMKSFLMKALIIAVIAAFALSFSASIIYNQKSLSDIQDNYLVQETYRLEYNSYVINKMFADWEKDLNFFASVVISSSDLANNLDDESADFGLPIWLERQMFHSGYTEFEYQSLDSIRTAAREEWPYWIKDLPEVSVLSEREDKIYISWQGADTDGGKSYSYFRLSSPVWLQGQATGSPDGIFSFIFPVEQMITGSKLHQGAVISHMMLTDSNTRIIAAFDDRSTRTNIRAVQEVRDAVNSTEEGLLEIRRGVYLWNTIDIPANMKGVGQFASSGSYYLISEIESGTEAYWIFSNSVLYLLSKSIVDSFVPFLILTLFAAVIACILSLRKHQQIRAKYLTEYDQMSGTLNRYTGLRKMQKVFEDAENLREVAICFVDINGLKQVNDVLGHELGDELITTAAQSILESIRRDDFVIRMGGDEFLLVLPGVPAEQAELIWLRIKDNMKKINKTENRAYLISASHGIVVIKTAEKDKIEEYISKADSIMYEEKRRIKAKLHVIRDTETV